MVKNRILYDSFGNEFIANRLDKMEKNIEKVLKTPVSTLFKTPVYKPCHKLTKSVYSCDFALTWTLMPVMKRMECKVQYAKAVPVFMDKLKHCFHSTVVELTKDYDVHFHSIIKIDLELCKNNPRKYLIDLFRDQRNMFGKYTIDPVTDYNGWIDYLKVDIEKTKEDLLECQPVILLDNYKVLV